MHVIVTICFEVFSLGVEYMQIVETKSYDAELKYQCECGTWLKSEYSDCEKCEKKEKKEFFIVCATFTFSLAVIVGYGLCTAR